MKLDEIEMLCNEATPGPWTYSETTNLDSTFKRLDAVVHEISDPGNYIYIENAKFIAASRTLMPKLLAVAKAYDEIKNCAYDHEPFCCCRLNMFDPVDLALKELEKE